MADNEDTPIQQLREAAERGKTATAENAELKRKIAFMEAGIDTNDPKAKYFVKGYEGELTTEAIKAEAAEAGILGEKPAPSTETETETTEPQGRRTPTEDEVELETMGSEITSEAGAPGEMPERDELEVGWEQFSERRKSEPVETASSEVISRLIAKGVGKA